MEEPEMLFTDEGAWWHFGDIKEAEGRKSEPMKEGSQKTWGLEKRLWSFPQREGVPTSWIYWTSLFSWLIFFSWIILSPDLPFKYTWNKENNSN